MSMTGLLCALLLLQFPSWSLRGETAGWLASLANRGYTVFQYHGLLLSLNRPQLIPVTLQAFGDGIFGALGGPHARVIRMELLKDDEILSQCGTDDLPLIPMVADSANMVTHIRLTLEETTHGALAESVFVYAVLKPVDPDGL